METELGPKGYTIPLKSLPPHFLENIRQELTVKPLENPNFQTNEPAFPVYRISKNNVYLPRFYGIEKYKSPKRNNLSSGQDINLTFNGTLRDIQQQTIDKTMVAFQEHGSGLISLDTGLGKTVVALNLVSLMKVKTIIIVHAEFLLEQWRARILQYLPEARIGIIRQERCEIEDVDISVGMIQTIVNRNYPKEYFNTFGFMIIDECFPYNQLIVTEIGKVEIGILYTLWKSNKTVPFVLSYNEKSRVFEYKKITFGWERQNDELLEISFLKQHIVESIKCTENHKILTESGYKEANKLIVGDVLICNNGNVTVRTINPVKNETPFVYDIEVQDNHNFIACGKSGSGPVVHNCHHVSSRTFSSIFYKVQTKYMVGLSATPERKDGLSKIIYWFLGPLIISIKRETGKPSITFVRNDTTGYTEEYNRLGKINNPSMITTLTKRQGRNELIVNLIISYLKQQRKILVLSDRREHCELILKQLPETIQAGVYLGGMTTASREITINCSVIIGTYQASGEGFDVPELDTLILATPKSDVEQAVGRILRQKNKNEPIVIDIVDSFSIFNGQYYKRRKFYKGCEFKMVG